MRTLYITKEKDGRFLLRLLMTSVERINASKGGAIKIHGSMPILEVRSDQVEITYMQPPVEYIYVSAAINGDIGRRNALILYVDKIIEGEPE